MHYVKVKREQFGRCNICGNRDQLTWDHIPPQGGIELTTVQMRSVFQVLTGNSEGFKTIESQNGVKYRTICKHCNETMGQKYDTVLNSFALTVGRYLRTLLTLPRIINHPTRPGALIRGILGHIIAAKVQPDEAVFDKQVAPLVFADSQPIPDDIHIFYWLYPYDFSSTIRDLVISFIPNGSKTIHYCQLIKYFPIAYLITNQAPYEGLLELTKYRHASIHEEIAIPIDLKSVKPVHWPEMVDDNRVVLGGQGPYNSVFASRKSKRG